jgi:hypothetical protein
MTTGAFWKAVAQMGGYLARQGDGPAGWKTLWKGWFRVQALLEGVHLAFISVCKLCIKDRALATG